MGTPIFLPPQKAFTRLGEFWVFESPETVKSYPFYLFKVLYREPIDR